MKSWWAIGRSCRTSVPGRRAKSRGRTPARRRRKRGRPKPLCASSSPIAHADATPAAPRSAQRSVGRETHQLWAMLGRGDQSSAGYQTLASAQSSGQSIGATPVTSGMMAACFQFGPAICNNDVAALQSGQPCGGASPININSVPRNQGSATTDGNGQTICSWGGNIQANINSAAASCTNGVPCAPVDPAASPTPPVMSPTDIVVS